MVNISKYYQDVDLNGRILAAKPHELTTMLLERVQSDLRIAKVAIENGEIATKCKHLSSATNIISHLESTLNPEIDPQLCEKLSATYEYLCIHLVAVNAFNDLTKLDECQLKIASIVTWWKQMVDALESQE